MQIRTPYVNQLFHQRLISMESSITHIIITSFIGLVENLIFLFVITF